MFALDAKHRAVTLSNLELAFHTTKTPEDIAARVGEGMRTAPQASRAGTVAVLPLYGVIAHRMNLMTDVSGGTSTEQFGAQFDALVADPNISAIVLDVDSPGGATAGVPDLASRIRAARGTKPIYAVANAVMASAAYWVAAQADEVIATPSAMVGSIGVIAVHTDASEANALSLSIPPNFLYPEENFLIRNSTSH